MKKIPLLSRNKEAMSLLADRATQNFFTGGEDDRFQDSWFQEATKRRQNIELDHDGILQD